jgi:hypothetical protein
MLESENRRRRAEDGEQNSEVRSQEPEYKAETREQNTGVRSQKSEYKAEAAFTDSLLFYSGS